MNGLPSALEKNYDGWAEYFASIGEPPYRATQICAWIWKRGVTDVALMTDFGKNLREKLSESLDFSFPEIVKTDKSTDGTKKFLVRMNDGIKVETALISMGPRLSACVSTQAGCPVGCPFCVTGAGGFERNLTAGEIAYQFVTMEREAGREIGSAVFMGMGEPFLNTDATLGAVRILNSPKMRGLGIRHITVSTAGIVPGIEEFTASGLGARLAVSLHAARDELRNELVPCNSGYSLKALMASLHDYQRVTGDRVTIEYALFKGVNDTLADARELARLLHGLHSYVNLIPGNENGGGYERSAPESVLKFQSVLKSAGFESEIRTERGGEINAACGQLRKLAPSDTAAPKAPHRKFTSDGAAPKAAHRKHAPTAAAPPKKTHRADTGRDRPSGDHSQGGGREKFRAGRGERTKKRSG
ncbi:MAG: 23S rRNA (adenine(2503)-C(2))-methyltransferase RlmN [Synergistaceae bacterium]|nr:23S rRNA (adenine(2503)-C(2))-methyltransferase RlmN [Synergistaceae bacterium]